MGLADEIASKIRRRIEDETYRPGERLPTLNDLAEEFSASTATVRLVIHTLVGSGHLEPHGRSWRVNSKHHR